MYFCIFVTYTLCLKQAEDSCLASGAHVKQSGLKAKLNIEPPLSLLCWIFDLFRISGSDQSMDRGFFFVHAERSVLPGEAATRKCFSQIVRVILFPPGVG